MLASNTDDIIGIFNEIEKSESELNSKENNPIIINCGYGYGRTAIMILFDLIKHILIDEVKSEKNITYRTTTKDELKHVIYSIQSEIAYGALTGISLEDKQLENLQKTN